MSQVSIVDIEANYPQIPTLFLANQGSAIPVANTLEIYGEYVVASGIPVQTIGSGNNITTQVQIASAINASDVTAVGLAAFDDNFFSVDPNGFVSFVGGGGGDVVGPPSSVDDDIVLFDGLTGKLIKDSGVSINDVVLDVVGTADRITVTGTSTRTVDIASTYVGQTSITTLGTITTGVWNATVIGTIYGGTGLNSYTTGDILYASATNTLSKLAATTDGYVLTLASGIPSWAAPASSGISTINGDSGSISGSSVTIFANRAAKLCGQTVLFTNSATTSTLSVSDAGSNATIGQGSGTSTMGLANVCLGINSLGSLNGSNPNASFNVAMGYVAGASLTTGSHNVCIGQSSANGPLTASYNVLIGSATGTSYTGAESSNILIGANNTGTVGESNVLRIGVGTGTGNGQINTTYIAGINGKSVSNQLMVVLNSSTEQLGTATIPIGMPAYADQSSNFNISANNGYFCTSALTASLPASPSQGNKVYINTLSTSIVIQANTGQTIRIGTQVSTTAGTATNNASGDSIVLVYRSSGSLWMSEGSPQGTWTCA